jgi:hypothetical protein
LKFQNLDLLIVELRLAEIRAALGPALLDGSGAWIIDYVRLRFSASKPEC